MPHSGNIVWDYTNLGRCTQHTALANGLLNISSGGGMGAGGSRYTISKGGNDFINSDFIPGQAAFTFLRWYGGGFTLQVPAEAVRACLTLATEDESDPVGWRVWSNGYSAGCEGNRILLELWYITADDRKVQYSIDYTDENQYQSYTYKNVLDEELVSDDHRILFQPGCQFSGLLGMSAVGNKHNPTSVSISGINFILDPQNVETFLDTGVNPEASSSSINTTVTWYYNFINYSTFTALTTNFELNKVLEHHYKETTDKKVAFYYNKNADTLTLYGYGSSALVSYDGVTWQSGVASDFITLDNRKNVPVLGKGTTTSYYEDPSWTNIPIYDDLQYVQDYINSDYDSQAEKDAISQAENNPFIQDKIIGYDEEFSTLGNPDVDNIFTHQYILNDSALREINSIIFDSSTSLDEFMDGTKCWGSNAINALVSLIFYPFDVEDIVNSVGTNVFSVGLFNKQVSNSLKEIQSLDGTLDMGTVDFNVVFGDYRDYEPFRRLVIYLPYVGVRELEIAKYIGKRINLRYAVDLTTGSCMAILYANSIIMDTFDGYIGHQIPITSTDQYQNSQARFNTVFSSVQNAIGSLVSADSKSLVEGAIGGTIQNVALAQNVPVNLHGSFGPMLGEFDRQYPVLTVATLDTVIPANENQIVGYPSNQGGKLSQFSGYIECSKVTLSSRATSEEIEMIKNELYKGIYI